jgi:hypothetical protein
MARPSFLASMAFPTSTPCTRANHDHEAQFFAFDALAPDGEDGDDGRKSRMHGSFLMIDADIQRRTGSIPLTLVSCEQRADILPHPNDSIVTNSLFGLPVEIPLRALRDFVRHASFGGGLEEREIVQFVVLVVDHHVSRDLGVVGQPRKYFVASWTPGSVRADINERHAPMLCRQQADGITSPRG